MEVHRLLVLNSNYKLLFVSKPRKVYKGFKCNAIFEDDFLGRKVDLICAYRTSRFIYLEVCLNEGWLKDLVPGDIIKARLY